MFDELSGREVETRSIEAFLDRRRGMLENCWLPTYRKDITVLGITFPFWWSVDASTQGANFMATRSHWRYWIVRTPGDVVYRCRGGK